MKNKFFIFPVLLFLSILLIFFYLLIIERNPLEIPSVLLNKKVPRFESNLLFKENKFISNNEFGNGKVLVNFFASWCKPCIDEHKFIKLFEENPNLKIVGINFKDNKNNVTKWLKDLGNPYSDIVIDRNGSIAIDWGVYGIPETFVINSKGIIKYRHVGQINKSIYKKINSIILEIE